MKELLYLLSEAVHQLQKERGCTSMFLSSEGTCFATKMQEQWHQTNIAIGDLQTINTTLLSQTWSNKLKTLIQHYQTLDDTLRDQIANQTITAADAVSHYSYQLISPLLLVTVEIALTSHNHNPSLVACYNAFLYWKERVGMERATGIRGCFNHNLEETEFLDPMMFLLSEQENYKNTLLVLASPKQKELILQLDNTAAFVRLEQLHQQLQQTPVPDSLRELDGEYWFELLTEKIELLRSVEKPIIDSLSGDELPEIIEKNINKDRSPVHQYRALIRSLQLFAGVDDDQLDAILHHSQIRKLNKGITLFLEDEQANRLYIVMHGWIKLSKNDSAGQETTLQIHGSGDPVMESAVFLQSTFAVNAQAVKEAAVLSIPAPLLRQQIQNSPQLTNNLLTSMSWRTQGLIRQIEDTRLKSVDERVGWFLLSLQLRQGVHSLEIRLPYEKSLIASYLDMKRETLSRSLQRLKSKGFIIGSHSVSLPYPGALCQFCDSQAAKKCKENDSGDCTHKLKKVSDMHCSNNG